jgi:2-amino-4-hydroxy-6-hydroxymethyldihydropteridine diphosphokinase
VTTEVVYVALGSNLGDRHAHLADARRALALLPRTSVIAVSAIEETEPLGALVQPLYLNQMVAIRTSLEPRELLANLQSIEKAAGRVRGERWAARTLDLDIVRFGSRVVNEPDLRIPHPGLAERDFWQRELAELEPRA